MSTAILEDEIVSINAIYGPDTLTRSETSEKICVLQLPVNKISLRIAFPAEYPDSIPLIEGPEASGLDIKKGGATAVVEITRDVLQLVFRPGEPCIYDLLEELSTAFSIENEGQNPVPPSDSEACETPQPIGQQSLEVAEEEPPWVVSTAVTEKKSVFLARAAPVNSPAQAKSYIQHLVKHDKKAAKATHNITAWRIKDTSSRNENGLADGEVIFQDCDDDGETAAGGRLLHLLQMMDAWNVVVVVSRWYGGIHLGPDRFRLISTVAREVILEGDFVDVGAKGSKRGKRS